MKKNTCPKSAQTHQSRVLLLLLLFLLVAMAFWLLLKGDRKHARLERRDLAQRPTWRWASVADGSWMKGVESWLQDQFWGREQWLRLETFMDLGLGAGDNGRVYFGRNGRLFLYETAQGIADKTGQREALFADNVEELARFFATTLPEAMVGRPLQSQVLMLVPPAAAVLPEGLPVGAVPWSLPLAEKVVQSKLDGLPVTRLDVWQALCGEGTGATSGVKTARETLGEADAQGAGQEADAQTLNPKRARVEREAFFLKTDHHWTSLGAWQAAQAYVAALDLPVNRAEDYEAELVTTDFAGSLAARAPGLAGQEAFAVYRPTDAAVKKGRHRDPRSVRQWGLGGQVQAQGLYVPEALQGEDPYLYQLGDYAAFTRIQGGPANHRHLLLVRDSFGNAFLPAVVDAFETIDIVDPRHGEPKISSLLAQTTYTDVLLLYSYSQLATDESFYRLND